MKRDKSKNMKEGRVDADMPSAQSFSNDDDDEEEEDIFDMIESGKIDEFVVSTNSAPSSKQPQENGTMKHEGSRTLDISRFNSSSESDDDSNGTGKITQTPIKKLSKSDKSQSNNKSEPVKKKAKKSAEVATPEPKATKPAKAQKKQVEKQSEETNGTDSKKKLSKSEKKLLRKEKAVVDPKKAKHEKSDQQRKESFKKRQQEVQNQKKLIQKALANVDKEATNKRRIVFDDSGSGEDESMDTSETAALPKTGKTKAGLQLFDADSESDVDEDAFKIRPEYEGKKGQKLMKLQAKQKARDDRFRLDQRFVDSSSSDEQDEAPVVSEHQDEKQKSLEVLKGIVGERAVMASRPVKMIKDMNALRYDPATDDTPTQHEDTAKAKKKQKKKEEKEATELPEVSKERFFKVEGNLKAAFSKDSKSTGFSLLSMFGSGAAEDSQQQGSTDAAAPFSWAQETRKFSDESSTDDDDDDDEDVKQKDTEEKPAEEKAEGEVAEKGKAQSVGAATLSTVLMGTHDHPLIQENYKSFCGKAETSREEWKTKRVELVDSFRTKRKRSLRKQRMEEQKKPQKWHKRK